MSAAHNAEADAGVPGGCVAMRGGGYRHSVIEDGHCVYCGARVTPPGQDVER